MEHTLPELSYDFGALEPHIDAKTMEIHYTKHHQAYITNLNKALAGTPELQDLEVEELIARVRHLPDAIQTAIRNHGGGHANHTLFWSIMMQGGGGTPKGGIADSINGQFGGFDAFQTEFNQAAMTRFGSGWAWLSVDSSGRLLVESTANQDSPLMEGRIPILGLDVWEHAYYLKYQNRRPDYIKAWWNTVNWQAVDRRLKTAISRSGSAGARGGKDAAQAE